MEPSMLRLQDASGYDPVADVIEAIRCGELVVVVDDEDRENEGDLICAAEKITAEKVNFMARYGRGLICVAVPPSHSHRLGLHPMKREREPPDRFGTAWLESVDASNGVTTRPHPAWTRFSVGRMRARGSGAPRSHRGSGRSFAPCGP